MADNWPAVNRKMGVFWSSVIPGWIFNRPKVLHQSASVVRRRVGLNQSIEWSPVTVAWGMRQNIFEGFPFVSLDVAFLRCKHLLCPFLLHEILLASLTYVVRFELVGFQIWMNEHAEEERAFKYIHSILREQAQLDFCKRKSGVLLVLAAYIWLLRRCSAGITISESGFSFFTRMKV